MYYGIITYIEEQNKPWYDNLLVPKYVHLILYCGSNIWKHDCGFKQLCVLRWRESRGNTPSDKAQTDLSLPSSTGPLNSQNYNTNLKNNWKRFPHLL